jgi:hypothetical protein
MIKTLKLISAFLVISIATFSQKKDSALRLGESWESDYGAPTQRNMVSQELYFVFVLGDIRTPRNAKRLFSVLKIGDTATIEANKLPETIKDVRWIRIGDMYFKRQEKIETPFTWQW